MNTWTLKFDYLNLLAPDTFLVQGIQQNQFVMAVEVAQKSIGQIMSAMRSKIWGDDNRDIIPSSFTDHMIEQNMRRCVRAHQDVWKQASSGAYAVFIISWEPKVTFDKVQQNRLYQVRLGEKPFGRLRRPKQAGGWLYLPEGGAVSDQISVGLDLDSARKTIVSIIGDMHA